MDNKMPKTSSTFNCCKNEINFHWKIYDFSLISFQNNIESSVFPTSNLNDIKLKLVIYPNKDNFEKAKFISLELVNLSKENLRVSCIFSIMKNNGSKYSHSLSDIKIDKKLLTHNLKVFSRYYFINNVYLKDDTLYIKCKIKWYKEEYKYYLQDEPNLDMKDVNEDLSKVMSSFFNDENCSDVSLEVGDVTFRVHKVILAARSSVFAAMFEHEMKETKENVVKIKEMEPEIVKEMLRFIYTGRVEGLEEKAIELLKAADMYDLNKLKLKCETTICKYFTVDNVTDFFDFAEIYNAQNLKNNAVKFINCNIDNFSKL